MNRTFILHRVAREIPTAGYNVDWDNRAKWEPCTHAEAQKEVAYLVDIQPLPEGQQSPIYRFPGGDRVVDPHDIKNGVVRIIEW